MRGDPGNSYLMSQPCQNRGGQAINNEDKLTKVETTTTALGDSSPK
jgi:hypothetical protein